MGINKKALAKLKQRAKKRDQQPRPNTLTNSQMGDLDLASELIENQDWDSAKEVLLELEQHGVVHVDLYRMLQIVFQNQRDHLSAFRVSRILMQLDPDHKEDELYYAQEALWMGWPTIAAFHYTSFLERAPSSPFVEQARNSLEIATKFIGQMCREVGGDSPQNRERLYLQEQSLGQLQMREFGACAVTCRKILSLFPDNAAARNNLAQCHFHLGKDREALRLLEETRESCGNELTSIMLARLYFLSGRPDDAQRLADELVARPLPKMADATTILLGTLAMLGRDRELLQLADDGLAAMPADHPNVVQCLHLKAYAQCRLGALQDARKIWNECLKRAPSHSMAIDNLEALKQTDSPSPWANNFSDWVPDAVFQSIRKSHADSRTVLSQWPAFRSLLPSLLDRGDEMGRRLAIEVAKSEKTPDMIESLRQFAFGSRGTDELRGGVMSFLRDEGFIGRGPHSFLARGKWTSIELITTKIDFEPRPSISPPAVLKLIETGVTALCAGDLDRAERDLEEAMTLSPDDPTPAFNLYTLWMRRGTSAAKERAADLLKRIRETFPDYLFGAVASAHELLAASRLEEAERLVAPFWKAESLHADEATALFGFNVKLRIERGDIAAAREALNSLRRTCGDERFIKQAEMQLRAAELGPSPIKQAGEWLGRWLGRRGESS